MAFLAGSLAASASAQTITVDTAADVVDFAGAQRVADLPGPDGKVSLDEAGLASDNTPGVQTIAFHVPQSEWTYQWLYPGRAVLVPFLGFRVWDTAIIDATTQTAFTGDTNPAGGEVVIFSQFFMINNVGGAVRGLDFSQIGVSGGSGNVIQGNTNCAIELADGTDGNLIGGTAPGEGNIGSGHIKLVSASNNVVVGNTVQSVRVLGNGPLQPPTVNNRIGGPTLAERNTITGRGSMSSQGYPGGMAIEIGGATGTVIENNWIGLGPDGLSQGHPYVTVGILLWGGDNSTTLIRDNRIAGIHAFAVHPYPHGAYYGTGIVINGDGSGVTIVGNKIGLNANDQPVLGCVIGISTANDYYGNMQNVVIGGAVPGEGNEIAGNDHEGIVVDNAYSGVRISGNSIHDNGTLGIELIDSGFLWGMSPNDALDVDTGANGLQNFPVVQSASVSGTSITVGGTLDSTPSSTFGLEFFASSQCDALGFGEGQIYLGSSSTTTNASGSATFSTTLAASVPIGWFVTATATHATSASTSEFSACAVATLGVPPASTPFCFGDGTATACPCGNVGALGNGCAHSLNANGAHLSASGVASVSAGSDTLVLTATNISGPGLFFQGMSTFGGGNGSAFGDGLLCAGGTITRLGVSFPTGGSASYPSGPTPTPISVAGAPIVGGDVRHYQCWYRDAASFCTTSTFNLTQGLTVPWVP